MCGSENIMIVNGTKLVLLMNVPTWPNALYLPVPSVIEFHENLDLVLVHTNWNIWNPITGIIFFFSTVLVILRHSVSRVNSLDSIQWMSFRVWYIIFIWFWSAMPPPELLSISVSLSPLLFQYVVTISNAFSWSFSKELRTLTIPASMLMDVDQVICSTYWWPILSHDCWNSELGQIVTWFVTRSFT